MPRQPRTSANKGSKVKSNEQKKKVTSTVPYAHGFKPSTASQRKNAVGFGHEIPTEFDPDSALGDFSFFKPMPAPVTVDDWLAQYCEEGQSYQQFLKECPWLSTRKRKYMSQEFTRTGQTILEKYPNGKIYIVPIGDFKESESKLYASLLEYTEIFLGLPVVTLPPVKLEVEGGNVNWVETPEIRESECLRSSHRTKRHILNSRYNSSTQHRQLCVDSNLMQLRRLLPRDAICMIGLTMMDLYGEVSDLFVAGMAAGNERVAIFSLFRYDPCLSFSCENWFDVQQDKPMAKADQQRLILQRGCKLLVHEIGHLLGIGHCIFYDCCMNGSGHLEEDFRQAMQLCPVDLHKLYTLVGFDLVERYKALLRFYTKQKFQPEATWVEKRLEVLTSV